MIKVIVGFREDQYYLINETQAHKAYYLFTHPDERSVFEGGIAIIGKHIQGIEPAYQETMGWNPTHELDNDDWNEIRARGVDKRLREVLMRAKEVAELASDNPKLLDMTLDEIENGGQLKNEENLKRIADMKNITI